MRGVDGEVSRKRVLLLFKALGRGGAEQLLVNAAPYLDTAEFQYEAAYLDPKIDALVKDIEDRGLRVHCLGGTSKAAWMARLRRLVRRRKVDVVHMHSPYAAVGARVALKGPGGPRLVYTEHNVWEAYHPLTRRGNMLTFPLNDHVFTVSEHVRQSIRYPWAIGFLPMPPVETLYHGLDLASVRGWAGGDGVRESLGIAKDAPVVGTVANFRVEKGHRYLLEAAVRVRRSFPQVRFVLVGYGRLEGTIRRQVRQLGLEPNVIFAGLRSDVPRLTASFDVFALPSIYEGLSIALVEALTVGTPAVVTRTGGVVEVVKDGVNAIVVPPRDPVALGDAIVSVLSDPSLQRTLAAAGKERAAEFDIRTAVRRTEEVYRTVLGMKEA
jgi:glycosyltransferase involved in cell wall biosynthesis